MLYSLQKPTLTYYITLQHRRADIFPRGNNRGYLL